MANNKLGNYSSIVIGTGNVLRLDEFKKATTSASEMAICVKTAISDIVENLDVNSNPLPDYVSIKSDLDVLETSATTKIIAKIFLNDFATNYIEDAMENLLNTVQGRTINTVILAYHPFGSEATNKDKFVWANDDTQSKENFKVLWNQLRTYVASGKIRQLGIADVGLETILEVFEDKYDFDTLQINLATCCVVPPALQQFCKERDIQLLTHSDPQELYPSSNLDELDLQGYRTKWALRFHVHLVDRGILAAKGFIVNIAK